MVGWAPLEIMRARWLASRTSSNRLSTLSTQSSTVTRAIQSLLSRLLCRQIGCDFGKSKFSSVPHQKSGSGLHQRSILTLDHDKTIRIWIIMKAYRKAILTDRPQKRFDRSDF
jgi:hypothetical protein